MFIAMKERRTCSKGLINADLEGMQERQNSKNLEQLVHVYLVLVADS